MKALSGSSSRFHSATAGLRKARCGAPPGHRTAHWHSQGSAPRGSTCHVISDTPVSTSHTSHGAAKVEDRVDWRNAWYIAYAVQDLPTDRPFAITILGKRLVVWLDGDEQWRVFEDSCPHRKVALSEGRIEDDGNLSCAYHGWRFDGNGTCTTIPQLGPDELNRAERVASSPLACATAFPAREAEGVLWVWMNSDTDAFQQAASTPIPISEGYTATTPWTMRDLPMSWEVLMENVQDPSHVPFSHHGVQGNRDKPTKPNLDRVDSYGKKGYVTLESQLGAQRRRGLRYARMRLDASHMPSRYDICVDACEAEEGAEPPSEADAQNIIKLRTHCIPVSRTWSRMAVRVEYYGNDNKIKKAMKLRPRWHDHLERNAVLDGDGIFLHKQDTLMQQGEISPRDYFMPAKADLAVDAFWKFMRQYAPDGIDYYPHDAKAGILPREQILDRYGQHTKNCSSCKRALANVQVAQRVAVSVATAVLCTVVVLLARGHAALSVPMAAAVLLAGAAGFAYRALHNLEKQFVFADYVHADK